METIKNNELKEGYSIYGNKGNVWSNQAHIKRNGASVTLCGVPMLSKNWARAEAMQEIRCQKCIEIYKGEN